MIFVSNFTPGASPRQGRPVRIKNMFANKYEIEILMLRLQNSNCRSLAFFSDSVKRRSVAGGPPPRTFKPVFQPPENGPSRQERSCGGAAMRSRRHGQPFRDEID